MLIRFKKKSLQQKILIIDAQKYQTHPDCKTLICFVYEPEGRIANPRGIEKYLSKEFNGLPVSVFITL